MVAEEYSRSTTCPKEKLELNIAPKSNLLRRLEERIPGAANAKCVGLHPSFWQAGLFITTIFSGFICYKTKQTKLVISSIKKHMNLVN